jgi:hypothetical protein
VTKELEGLYTLFSNLSQGPRRTVPIFPSIDHLEESVHKQEKLLLHGDDGEYHYAMPSVTPPNIYAQFHTIFNPPRTFHSSHYIDEDGFSIYSNPTQTEAHIIC